MTLEELVTQIGDTTGQSEPEELAAARRFLRNRLKMLWDAEAWLDAQVETTLPIVAADALHAAGLVKVACVYSRLLGVRTGDTALEGRTPQYRYRVAQDIFEGTGTALLHTELGAVVEILPRPCGIRLAGNPGQTDAGKRVWVRYITEAGARVEETWTMGLGESFEATHPAIQIEAVTKEPTLHPVAIELVFPDSPPALYGGRAVEAGRVEVGRIGANETSAARCRWLRIGERPAADLALRVLGRTHAPAWREEELCPLTGAANALLAFGLGDAERRARQFGRANSYFEEAGALIGSLKKQEVDQTTQRVVLQPSPEVSDLDVFIGGWGGGY